MASVELLKMTQSVDDKVMGVDDRVKDVEGKIRGDVHEVRDDVHEVRDDVQDIHDKVQDVDDRVQDIGKDISVRVQGVEHKLDQANRALFSLTPSHHSDGSNNITGDQLRDKLIQWLSPPDPSVNHNIASNAHHNGTAEWFFRGSIFGQWKSTDSLMWIHGKRALSLAFTCPPLIVSCFYSGVREKCPLVRPSFDSFHSCETDSVVSVPQLYKISLPCAMPGGPQWPISTSISGTLKSKNLQRSSLSRPALCAVRCLL